MSNYIPPDITGRRFGRWYVLGFDRMRNGKSYWWCRCDCGTERSIRKSHLVNGESTSCGCRAHDLRALDLVGERFGRWYVLGFDHADARGRQYWLCKCDCGAEKVVSGSSLRSGHSTSCGCLKGELSRERVTKHGMRYDRLYHIWSHMKQRCVNENNPHYSLYGGRGIFICDEWLKFENFRDWALDNGYSPDLTIDRIDNDDSYYPENCRWTDRLTQANNNRQCHYVTYSGITHTVSEWARLLNVNYRTLLTRINRNDMQDFERYYGECEE